MSNRSISTYATLAWALALTAAPAMAQTGSAPAAADEGDIIVTAQRQSERLRDVPITITALNSEGLEKAGVTNTLDLQRVTPGLQMVVYGAFLQPAIRGISSAGAGLGDSSNVAVYVDGVYQPSMSGQLMDLPDVQQIEVLKGPQGTLYGQNAAGGAIKITSITPAFDLKGKLSASYGNYNDTQFRGYITGPISDNVALLVSGGWRDRDGFRKDLLRGGRGKGLKSELIRGKLLFNATDRLSFTASAYYTHRLDGDVYAGQPYSGPGAGTALGYALGTAYSVPLVKPANSHQQALNVPVQAEFKTYGFNLTTEYKADDFTISMVNAYSNVKVHNIADIDFTSANIGDVDLPIHQHAYVNELNFFTTMDSPLNVSAGVFYMKNSESYTPQLFFQRYASGAPTTYPTLPTPAGTFGYYAQSHKRSFAAYAELSYRITEALTLTAGGRYAREKADTDMQLYPYATFPGSKRKATFSKFTPRATLRYAIDDNSNVYASFSQGFKSGFINPSDLVNPPVKPEVVTGYEVGYKGRLSDMVSLNLSVFHYDYKNLQVFVYVPPNGFYQNAAKARINGLEFDTTLNLAPGLTVTAGGSYLDGKYKSYDQAGVYVPAPPVFGISYGNVGTNVDASGNRLVRTPKFTGNFAIDYGFETGAGRMGINSSVLYNSGVTYSPDERLRQRRYATVNGELSFEPSGIAGLRLVAYGKNLTDKAYISAILSSQFVDGVSYAEPRTYGVRLEYAF